LSVPGGAEDRQFVHHLLYIIRGAAPGQAVSASPAGTYRIVPVNSALTLTSPVGIEKVYAGPLPEGVWGVPALAEYVRVPGFRTKAVPAGVTVRVTVAFSGAAKGSAVTVPYCIPETMLIP
jgi:hypothetical protein